jgi:hypothetical protein
MEDRAFRTGCGPAGDRWQVDPNPRVRQAANVDEATSGGYNAGGKRRKFAGFCEVLR